MCNIASDVKFNRSKLARVGINAAYIHVRMCVCVCTQDGPGGESYTSSMAKSMRFTIKRSINGDRCKRARARAQRTLKNISNECTAGVF